VPRLYEALWAAIEARLKGYRLTLRPAFRALLKMMILVQQSSGIRLGVFCLHLFGMELRRICDCWSRAEHGWRGRPRNSWKLSVSSKLELSSPSPSHQK